MKNSIVLDDSRKRDGNSERRLTESTSDVSKTKSNTRKIPQEALNLLAGGISGMVAKSFVAPIDRIKILYQVTSVEFRLRNVPGVAYSIINKEGLSALWKGNTATMLRVFPYSGIQFMVYDMAKNKIINSKDRNNDEGEAVMTPVENLLAGMCAGSISVLCTYPLDLTRAQLAVLVKDRKEARPKHSISSVFKNNFHQRGLSGLFRGIGPTMIGIMPYSGLAFTINEQTKNRIKSKKHREPTYFEKVQCGALSGAIAQSVTYPLEVIRRRMQTHGLISENISGSLLKQGKRQTVSSKATSHSPKVTMFSIMKHLYIEQGIAGFFKGLSMNWIKGPVAFGISFTTYDMMKSLLRGEESVSIPPLTAKMTDLLLKNENDDRTSS